MYLNKLGYIVWQWLLIFKRDIHELGKVCMKIRVIKLLQSCMQLCERRQSFLPKCCDSFTLIYVRGGDELILMDACIR